MRLVYCYTQSHKIFLQTFLGSLKDDFELVPYESGGRLGNIEYYSKEYLEGIQFKINCILDAINFGKPFVFSDVDIVFLKSIKDIFPIVYNYDVCLKSNNNVGLASNYWNTGLMFINPTKQVKLVYQSIKKMFNNPASLASQPIFDQFWRRKEMDAVDDENTFNAIVKSDPNILSLYDFRNQVILRNINEIRGETFAYHACCLSKSTEKIPYLKRALRAKNFKIFRYSTMPWVLPQLVIDSISSVKTVRQRKDKIGLILSLGLKTICEVGVRDGDHLLNVLIKSNPKLLIGVDLWLDDGIWSHNDIGLSQYAIDQMYSNLLKIQETKSNLQFLRMESTKAAKSFEDGFFDMVYIDAGYTYDAVKSDIEAWWPKVRIGGVLCGHDFGRNSVSEAVAGFINQHNIMDNFHSTVDEWFILKQ